MSYRANLKSFPDPLGDAVATYLDALAERLAGRIPGSECEAFLHETAEHLERLEEDARLAGYVGKDSSEHAVKSFGDPGEIAEAFVEGWFAGTTAGRISRRFGYSRTLAFAWFGAAEAVCVVLLLLRIYIPSGDALPHAISPARLRDLLPAPLPTPDFSMRYGVLLAAELLLPILAGVMVGRALPTRAERWCLGAIVAMIAYSTLLGFALQPNRDFTYLAFFQAIYWLPVGVLCARISSAKAWRRSRPPAHKHRPLT